MSLFAVNTILHIGKQNLHQKTPKLQNKDVSADVISVKVLVQDQLQKLVTFQ